MKGRGVLARKPNSKKIYRQKSPVAMVLGIIGLVAVILIIIGVFIFFSFQKYIVYEGDELTLKVPFLSFLDDEGDGTEQADIQVDDTGEADESGQENSALPLGVIGGIWAKGLQTSDEISVTDLVADMQDIGANTVCVKLKESDGVLNYASSVPGQLGLSISTGEGIAPNVTKLKEQGVYMVAVVSAFSDSTLTSASPATALTVNEKTVSGIVDPNSQSAVEYLTELCSEISAMGFDEIILSDFYIHKYFSDEQYISKLTKIAQELDEVTKENGTKLSLHCDGEAWEENEDAISDFSDVFYRLCADEDNQSAATSARTILGDEYFERFVLFDVHTVLEDCGWIK